MPGRLADLHDDIRRMVAELDKRRFRLKKNPTSATGFVNVIKVKGKYQARLQVPGEGRGGQIKRKQCSLPTTFDEAEARGCGPILGVGREPRPFGLGEREASQTHGAQAAHQAASTARSASRRCSAVCRGKNGTSHDHGRADQLSDAACAFPRRLAASDAATWLCGALPLSYVNALEIT